MIYNMNYFKFTSGINITFFSFENMSKRKIEYLKMGACDEENQINKTAKTTCEAPSSSMSLSCFWKTAEKKCRDSLYSYYYQ